MRHPKKSLIMSSENVSTKEPIISVTRRAYLTLHRQIIMGYIAPGKRLKVDALKSSLKTGNAPIREALSLLTSDHLVERIDHRGFRVTPCSRAQFIEILDLRCELEAIALQASLQVGNGAWEDQLVLTHHHLSRVSRDDMELFGETSQGFSYGSATGLPITDFIKILCAAL